LSSVTNWAASFNPPLLGIVWDAIHQLRFPAREGGVISPILVGYPLYASFLTIHNLDGEVVSVDTNGGRLTTSVLIKVGQKDSSYDYERLFNSGSVELDTRLASYCDRYRRRLSSGGIFWITQPCRRTTIWQSVRCV